MAKVFLKGAVRDVVRGKRVRNSPCYGCCILRDIQMRQLRTPIIVIAIHQHSSAMKDEVTTGGVILRLKPARPLDGGVDGR